MVTYNCDCCGVLIDDVRLVRQISFPIHISRETGDHCSGYLVQVKNKNGDTYTQPTSGLYVDKQLCIICDNLIQQAAFDKFNTIKDEHK